MKIKSDFVTNSSSASFIMIFEAVEKDIHEFIESFNDFMDYYKRNTGGKNLRFWDATNISEVGDGIYQVEEWMSMYNDIGDIPKYMQYIIVDSVASAQSALECRGIKFKSFDIEDES